MTDAELFEIAQPLLDYLAVLGPCVIAFSGGVDSAVVAAAAERALPRKCLAVTAVSPSLAVEQREMAQQVASQIGIEHLELSTDEIEREEYQRNDARRCYFCKQTLYRHLHRIAERRGITSIVSGTNADDRGDYRPGLEAGAEAGVRTPLADLEIDKATVRRLARLWNVSVWDAPASPCLASRIAYGVTVTPERLRMVDRAESVLTEYGFSPRRVRLHAGDLARIEVASSDIHRLYAPDTWSDLVASFRTIGFQFVTVDMEGFRSGNLNQLIPLTIRQRVTVDEAAAASVAASTADRSDAPLD